MLTFFNPAQQRLTTNDPPCQHLAILDYPRQMCRTRSWVVSEGGFGKKGKEKHENFR